MTPSLGLLPHRVDLLGKHVSNSPMAICDPFYNQPTLIGPHPGDKFLYSTLRWACCFFSLCVCGFFYPVVAKGQARISVQLSAAHEQAHLDKAIAAFAKVGKELGVLKSVSA